MTRLEKLRELEVELKELMNKANSRSFAPLAKQYRETIKEIEEIEGSEENDDEITALLDQRGVDGKSRAVRPDRS
jgi:hypothetical protein